MNSMAKKTALETDLATLKEKFTARVAEAENPKSDSKLRSLHKRLKRAQRKRRSLAAKMRNAMGKAGASEKTEAPKS